MIFTLNVKIDFTYREHIFITLISGQIWISVWRYHNHIVFFRRVEVLPALPPLTARHLLSCWKAKTQLCSGQAAHWCWMEKEKRHRWFELLLPDEFHQLWTIKRDHKILRGSATVSTNNSFSLWSNYTASHAKKLPHTEEDRNVSYLVSGASNIPGTGTSVFYSFPYMIVRLIISITLGLYFHFSFLRSLIQTAL